MAAPELRVEHEGSTCRLVGVIDFQTAPAALEAVSSLVAKQPSLTIDLAGVDKSNSAGLALLVEWLAVGRRSGHSVQYVSVPRALHELAKVCQVDSLLH